MSNAFDMDDMEIFDMELHVKSFMPAKARLTWNFHVKSVWEHAPLFDMELFLHGLTWKSHVKFYRGSGRATGEKIAAVGHVLALSNSFAAVGHRLDLSNSSCTFRFQLLRFGGARAHYYSCV